MDCGQPGCSVHGNSPGKSNELPCLPSGDLPNPGIKARSPALQADSLPPELPGKPKNTGVGSPFLLQGTFLTQGLNLGLPHCRQILYHLSYQGSPKGYGGLFKGFDFILRRVGSHLKQEGQTGELSRMEAEGERRPEVVLEQFKQCVHRHEGHEIQVCLHCQGVR